MSTAKSVGFNAPQLAGKINSQNPSYQTFKDSGSDSVSGLVDSEIVDLNLLASRNSEGKNSDLNGELTWDQVELENTELVVFDEVSEMMQADHLFRMVVWEWKMLPATLYNHLCRLDAERVREEIRQVIRKRGLRSKGSYLNTRLRNLKDSV